MMLSDRDFFARILREANSWTELGLHPNIAYCYFVKNIEEVPHIIVEYVDGGNLREWIEDGKCIDYRINLDLAIQFCHGMEHAHSKGMIHRDIKPENILMTTDGIVKITDFGLVSGQKKGIGKPTPAVKIDMEDPKIPDRGLTTIGTRMGTEGYMAPEQEENARDVDERADIFSFGVCLYEMFCGNKPYRITYGKKQDAPDPVVVSKDTQFPSDMAGVLTKCVQWERENRYQNFSQIRQELSKIYKSIFHEESPYAELELVDLEADGLNNWGVAYFELGRKEDAIECWEKSLKINQTHIEATYNLSLVEWRDGKIADDEVLRRLDDCSRDKLADQEKLAELKAYIHAERYAPDLAKDVLEKFPGRYEAIFSGKTISQIKCLHTMKGHTNIVQSIALTPDGCFAISGSEDKTLRLWDLETGQCLRTMEGHDWIVNSVALTPDGHYAVSGSGGSTAYGILSPGNVCAP
jgi:tetratricopeptide (TPR) repeat protein